MIKNCFLDVCFLSSLVWSEAVAVAVIWEFKIYFLEKFMIYAKILNVYERRELKF